MYVGSAKKGQEAEAMHVGRAEEAVQGRRGAEGEWSRQAVRVGRARMELESGPYEAREAHTRPKRSAGIISGDEAPARRYLRDLLPPTTKMGL